MNQFSLSQFTSLMEKILYGEQRVVQNKGLLGTQLADPQPFLCCIVPMCISFCQSLGMDLGAKQGLRKA